MSWRTCLTRAAAVAAVAALACAPMEPRGWDHPPGDECPAIVVENHAFEDVVVRMPALMERVGTVEGYTTRRFSDCRWTGRRSHFEFDAIGGRFDLRLEGAHSFQEHDEVHFIIENSTRLSHVIGNGFGAGPQDLILDNLTWVGPLYLHGGIWEDVRRCMGVDDGLGIEDVAWATADSIIDAKRDRLLFGATVFDYWDTTVIVIERPYWLHPTVISHEVGHALGASENGGALDRCVMPLPGELPERSR